MRAPIRLVVAAMLTLFSISVVSILLTHRATDEAEILSTMRSIQRNVSDATVERTDTFLLEAGEEAQLAVRLLESGTIEKGAGLEDYFAGVLQTSPELSGIFYGTESGEFLFVNRTDEVSPNGFRTKAITVTLAAASSTSPSTTKIFGSERATERRGHLRPSGSTLVRGGGCGGGGNDHHRPLCLL